MMAYKYLLLVEGLDDQHVLKNLMIYHQIPCLIPFDGDVAVEEDAIVIEKMDGIDRLLRELPGQLIGSELEALGIVVDADTDLESRWRALRNVLLRSGGVDIPTNPDPNGTMVIVEQPDRMLNVGIWLMPDNVLPGILENFVGFLIPADDTLWERAKDCVDRIPEVERKFSLGNQQQKAYVHTWLAWQQEPGKPLDLAITHRYLDANAPHAQQLVDWIRRLFDLPPNTIN